MRDRQGRPGELEQWQCGEMPKYLTTAMFGTLLSVKRLWISQKDQLQLQVSDQVPVPTGECISVSDSGSLQLPMLQDAPNKYLPAKGKVFK